MKKEDIVPLSFIILSIIGMFCIAWSFLVIKPQEIQLYENKCNELEKIIPSNTSIMDCGYFYLYVPKCSCNFYNEVDGFRKLIYSETYEIKEIDR